MWVRATNRFCNDILDAKHLKNSTHRATGDDTSTSRCRTKQNLTRTIIALIVMVQCATVTKGNANHIALSAFGCLTNGFRNLTGLACAETSAAFAITNHNQSGETKTATTLDNFSHTVNANQLFEQFGLFALLATVPSVVIACHQSCSLEFQTGFARGFSQRLDPAVENVTAAVENHCVNAFCLGALGDQFANHACCCNIGCLA